MTLGIIGLGYVGLTLGIAAADSGIRTYGIEINDTIKTCLKNDHAHFYEPGLDVLIKRHNNKNFFLVESFPENEKFDAFVITVGTPLKPNEKSPNFSYILSSLQAIKSVYSGKQLIILRSTVSVGTSRNIVLPELARLCHLNEEDLLLAMCPERTIEGKAIEELRTLPQIISGNNFASLEIAQNIFRMLTPYVIKVDSLEEAELVKLFCNTYRDITFSIGNVFCMAAQTFGVDGLNIIRAANQGYDRANISSPGFVSGPCLEKDAYILTNNMDACPSKQFILNARKFNESLEDIVVNWVNRILNANLGQKIAISGMAFKGKPETSDLRGSTSVYIAQKLKKDGYSLNLHDYTAKYDEMEKLNLGCVCHSIEEALVGADVLLVLNNHPNYSKLAADMFTTRKNLYIFDAWNSCGLLYGEGLNISNLGNLNILDKGEKR